MQLSLSGMIGFVLSISTLTLFQPTCSKMVDLIPLKKNWKPEDCPWFIKYPECIGTLVEESFEMMSDFYDFYIDPLGLDLYNRHHVKRDDDKETKKKAKRVVKSYAESILKQLEIYLRGIAPATEFRGPRDVDSKKLNQFLDDTVRQINSNYKSELDVDNHLFCLLLQHTRFDWFDRLEGFLGDMCQMVERKNFLESEEKKKFLIFADDKLGELEKQNEQLTRLVSKKPTEEKILRAIDVCRASGRSQLVIDLGRYQRLLVLRSDDARTRWLNRAQKCFRDFLASDFMRLNDCPSKMKALNSIYSRVSLDWLESIKQDSYARSKDVECTIGPSDSEWLVKNGKGVEKSVSFQFDSSGEYKGIRLHDLPLPTNIEH